MVASLATVYLFVSNHLTAISSTISGASPLMDGTCWWKAGWAAASHSSSRSDSSAARRERLDRASAALPGIPWAPWTTIEFLKKKKRKILQRKNDVNLFIAPPAHLEGISPPRCLGKRCNKSPGQAGVVRFAVLERKRQMTQLCLCISLKHFYKQQNFTAVPLAPFRLPRIQAVSSFRTPGFQCRLLQFWSQIF